MTKTMLNGLMMDDYPLTLTAVVERAEQFNAGNQFLGVVHSSGGWLVVIFHYQSPEAQIPGEGGRFGIVKRARKGARSGVHVQVDRSLDEVAIQVPEIKI